MCADVCVYVCLTQSGRGEKERGKQACQTHVRDKAGEKERKKRYPLESAPETRLKLIGHMACLG